MITLRSKRTAALGAGLLLASILGACGGGSSHTSTATSPTTAGNTSAAGGTGSGGGGGFGSGNGGSFPGASGSVAAITGTSMEVQNQQTGQVTVSWTAATTFTKTASLTAANVAAGDCVTVIGSSSTGKLVANTVMVSKPSSSGSCTGRFGAGGAGGAGGFRRGAAANGGSVPSRPAGSVPSGASGFGFASGKVTSISPSSMVIDGISSSGFRGARTGTGTSTPPTSIKPTTVTIGLQGSTTFSETESTAASSLAVGDCVTAVGSSNSTGAVTARTVRITSTGGQTCSTGFGGFGGGGAAGGGSASAGSGGSSAGAGSTNG